MYGRNSAGRGRRATAWPQALALVVGAVYTVVGVVGFFVTGSDDFSAHTGEELLGFEINPFHNPVQLVIGLAGLAWPARSPRRGAAAGC
jgi:hypothetical protein